MMYWSFLGTVREEPRAERQKREEKRRDAAVPFRARDGFPWNQ
jgi:hypothetical protein